MANSPRHSASKRSLEEIQDISSGEGEEKRPRIHRIVSDVSEVSVEEEKHVGESVDIENQETNDNSPAEVIYELSSDNDESLLNLSEKRSSNEETTPKKPEKIKDDDRGRSHDVKSESDGDEESGESEEAASAEESNENEDSEEEEKEDKDKDGKNKDQAKTGRINDDKMSSESSSVSKSLSEKKISEKVMKGVVDLSSSDESDVEEIKKKVEEVDVVDVSPETKHSDAEVAMDIAASASKTSSKQTQRKALKSGVDEVDTSPKELLREKRQRLESSDYYAKSMEDLEDLQEDLHKELAEINEKSRKHKKTSSAASHREKRHKEKTSSRHKDKDKDKDRERVKDGRERETEKREKIREKDRQRDREKEKSREVKLEKEKSRTSDNHGASRREVKLGARKDHVKSRKYETDDKPWLYESRHARSQKDERKPERGDRSWMQTRVEKPPSRTELKSVVTRKVRKEPKVSREDQQRLKETRNSQTTKEEEREAPKKGKISDSMIELLRDSMKDHKGFNQEVVTESDESPEPVLNVQASDVSSASPSDEEPEEPEESSPEAPKLPPYFPAIQGCRSVEEFQWLNRIEEGTYGVVYRAKDKRSGEIVALKKLKMEKEKEGFPITSLREINTLLKAQHPNIVTVQEIVVGSNMDKIYIVMDFVEHDLKALMETMTESFLAGEIKTIMIQLLRAVNHLHDNWILHRDIKTSNLLLSNKGILKVGDFGLAREYGSPLKAYTPIVVTLWYRAPELLLGAKEYSTPIDIWSVGCVFAELLTMKPLFNGQSEISQINKIFKELGTPSDKIWPGPPAYSEHPATKKMTFADFPYNNLRNRFGATLTDNGFDLLNSFLTYDPSRRITAEDALKHEYFEESPSPVDPSLFPSWPARSEGAKRAKKASPKAPEGGNFYKSLSEDGDGAFHIPVAKSQGKTTVPGFTLKF